METWTQLKSVIFTTDIFAVCHSYLIPKNVFCILFSTLKWRFLRQPVNHIGWDNPNSLYQSTKFSRRSIPQFDRLVKKNHYSQICQITTNQFNHFQVNNSKFNIKIKVCFIPIRLKWWSCTDGTQFTWWFLAQTG